MASSPTPLRPKTDAVPSPLEAQLDKSLDLLAKRYAQLPAQLAAEQKTLEALKLFTKSLSDDELDWLAAAGPGGVAPPIADPEDPAGLGKNRP